MDFELSDEQEDIQRAANEFAQGEFDPDLALELDQSGRFPESIWQKACQLGFIGLHYPEEFGGQGLGLLENVLVIEAFCRVDSGIGSALNAVDLGSEVILKFGSEEQKKYILPSLTKGKRKMSIAFAESEDDTDFSSVSTMAEKRGEYIIHGEKRFVVNATLADTFIVLCRELKEGLIMLMIEQVGGSLEVFPIEKMGLRMIPFGNLYFREFRVPHENRVGHEGEGLIQVDFYQKVIGIKNMAQALGVVQGAFDRAMQYARQREQFGRKLSQFQIIRHKLAEMAVGIEVARCLTYKSASDYDQGWMDPGFLSIAKLEVGRRLTWGVDEALQIFGGYGYIAEQAIEHYFRDAWVIEVNLGAEEELKDVIAARI